MSYGLISYDSSGRVQIDSTRSSDTGLIVSHSGTSSSITNVPASASVYANLSPSSGNIGFLAMERTGTTVNFKGTATSQQGPLSSAVSANYVVVSFASGINVSGGDYGIEILNSSGDTYYDTRMFQGNGGFGMAGYSAAQEHDGDTFRSNNYGAANNGPTDNLITSDTAHYVNMHSTFVGTVGTNTGNMVKGRYIVFANNFSASYSSVQGKGYKKGFVSLAYFTGTMSGIYFYRMRAAPQNSHVATPNPGQIPYGESLT